jgi:hypothetical protein
MGPERMFCHIAWEKMVLTTFQHTLLGGINMVDYEPWLGNYTGTTVHDNTIFGGFANEKATNDSTKGINAEDAIIKYVFSCHSRYFSD